MSFFIVDSEESQTLPPFHDFESNHCMQVHEYDIIMTHENKMRFQDTFFEAIARSWTGEGHPSLRCTLTNTNNTVTARSRRKTFAETKAANAEMTRQNGELEKRKSELVKSNSSLTATNTSLTAEKKHWKLTKRKWQTRLLQSRLTSLS